MQNDYHHHHPSPLRIKIIGKTIIKFIIFCLLFAFQFRNIFSIDIGDNFFLYGLSFYNCLRLNNENSINHRIFFVLFCIGKGIVIQYRDHDRDEINK